MTGPERQEQLPDVPTFTEAGLPQFDMSVWNAVLAPADTPDDIITKLADAINMALDDPAVQTRFGELGVPVPAEDQRGPEPLDSLIDSEVERWETALKGSGTAS